MRADSPIWRYLEFAKFVDLLERRVLHFCRSDLLGDPFEGSFPRNIAEREIEKLSAAGVDFDAGRIAHKIASRIMTEYSYVNCWYKGETESDLMWYRHVPSKLGVAIKSSEKLLECVTSQHCEEVSVIRVEYIDYLKFDSPASQVFFPYKYKRKEFADEHEVRAVYMVNDNTKTLGGSSTRPTGRSVQIDPKDLISEVRVSPLSPDWFVDLVRSMCKSRVGEIPVIHSSLVHESPIS